ncbi:hypothetical protein SAMN04488550_4406 [Gordonia malaquae]|uniref:Regulatory protein n=1 Tax=Gordonia malaquae NBRC 108250 TaxID=1223542 RepID=M3VBW2_GORML|nr:DUF5685 family protein [Gordonia malaquae]GAC80958.1 hypothetical protein GM1_025_00040 [Gordonia malaquae NBRC 108250]SEE37328.1 hypothetical protein SAMN04488550_4406 [Gordonia malaquae]
MFGLLQPCAHTLDDELAAMWRAHMCGLCLSLRDRFGQACRATTNTDAIMLSILTSAQTAVPTATRTAGPCPFRGMRSAEVVAGTDAGIELAATASMTLAAAKADDIVAEQATGLAKPVLVKRLAATSASGMLHRKIGDVAALDVGAVLAPLSKQAELESTTTDLDMLTEPTSLACAEVFAATADAAMVPQNRRVLWEIGADYGRLAHLIDAVDDRERDRAEGAFNPLEASGTTDAEAIDKAHVLVRRIADRYAELTLVDDRLLRALLIEGLARVVHSRRHAVHHHGEADSPAPNRFREWPDQRPPGYPSYAPYPPPFRPNRSFGERLLPFLGITCCGPAVCSETHWNHCNDQYKAGLCHQDDCCEACDCCSDCCDCGKCCASCDCDCSC